MAVIPRRRSPTSSPPAKQRQRLPLHQTTYAIRARDWGPPPSCEQSWPYQKKCPAIDFLGVAQSPKLSRSGTTEVYLACVVKQEKTGKKLLIVYKAES